MIDLKLVVFDATQLGRRPIGLGLSWRLGAGLYRGLGRIDAAFGARDWKSALDWLATFRSDRAIGELQYWGHGKWGRAFIDRESLDRSAFNRSHALHSRLEAFRGRLAHDALIWFRTCETAGGNAGHEFMSALGDFSGARVAGHTFEIAFFQSGLHELRPGTRPHWSSAEGLAGGSPASPVRALRSHPSAPNTITCLDAAIPESCRAPRA
jgi:hypothetical protein